MSSAEEIVDRLKVGSVVLGGQHVGVEVFPNQQTALLEQIAASLTRIEGLLERMQPTVVNISNPTPEHVVDAARKAHAFATKALREHYSDGDPVP